jgi:hypothetical protein
MFSVAAPSASLAGLAGLVAALRRHDGLRTIDMYRLQEIVEFAFANVLIALSFVVLASAIGETSAAQVAGVGILAYLVVHTAGLYQRLGRVGLERRQRWMIVVLVIDGLAAVLAVATAVTGSIEGVEALLIVLLARPMISFLFVLSSLEDRAIDDPTTDDRPANDGP